MRQDNPHDAIVARQEAEARYYAPILAKFGKDMQPLNVKLTTILYRNKRRNQLMPADIDK